MTVDLAPTQGAIAHMTYREKVNALRKRLGWSVKTLADKAKLKVGTVNGYLIDSVNTRTPSLKNAVKIAKALNVSMSEFEDCSDWEKPDPDSTSSKSD